MRNTVGHTVSYKVYTELTWPRNESLLESCTQEKTRTGKFSFSTSNIPSAAAPWGVESFNKSERCFTMNLWETVAPSHGWANTLRCGKRRQKICLTYFWSISTAWYPAAGSSLSSLVIRKMYSELRKGELFQIDLCIQQRQIYKAVNIDVVTLTNTSLTFRYSPLLLTVSNSTWGN